MIVLNVIGFYGFVPRPPHAGGRARILLQRTFQSRDTSLASAIPTLRLYAKITASAGAHDRLPLNFCLISLV